MWGRGGRGQQIYVSQEIPQICGVALPLSPAELRRSGFLINSRLVFPLCILERVFCVCPRENMCAAAPPSRPQEEKKKSARATVK